MIAGPKIDSACPNQPRSARTRRPAPAFRCPPEVEGAKSPNREGRKRARAATDCRILLFTRSRAWPAAGTGALVLGKPAGRYAVARARVDLLLRLQVVRLSSRAGDGGNDQQAAEEARWGLRRSSKNRVVIRTAVTGLSSVATTAAPLEMLRRPV